MWRCIEGSRLGNHALLIRLVILIVIIVMNILMQLIHFIMLVRQESRPLIVSL